MALQIEYESHYGTDHNYAHCVIRDGRFEKDKNEEHTTNEDGETETTVTWTFRVNYSGKIWASDDTYADAKAPIGGFNMRFELDVSSEDAEHFNFVKECYEHLKTQEGFTDGSDV
jgi:hypothetical protein